MLKDLDLQTATKGAYTKYVVVVVSNIAYNVFQRFGKKQQRSLKKYFWAENFWRLHQKILFFHFEIRFSQQAERTRTLRKNCPKLLVSLDQLAPRYFGMSRWRRSIKDRQHLIYPFGLV